MASPYMDGVRRALPIVLGYVPVAFAFGVLAGGGILSCRGPLPKGEEKG